MHQPTTIAVARRRLSFSLRTLLLAMTVLSGWLGWQYHWIRQRREILAQTPIVVTEPGRAPLGLRLLGEEGFASIDCLMRDDVPALGRLFPEAQVRHFDGCILWGDE